MGRKRNSARRNGAKARQAVSASANRTQAGGSAQTGAEELVVTPPTSPTSTSPPEMIDLVESVDTKDTCAPTPQVEDERTDWQALLPTVSGSSMFEVTPEKVLGEQPRRAIDAVTTFLPKEMQSLWTPVNHSNPDRPVSPVLHLGSTVWSVDTDHKQHEKERLHRQEQEHRQQQMQMQMLLQQQHDYYFYQQQQQLQQQQFYYQQQQQMMMMPTSQAMAQYPIAAGA